MKKYDALLIVAEGLSKMVAILIKEMKRVGFKNLEEIEKNYISVKERIDEIDRWQE